MLIAITSNCLDRWIHLPGTDILNLDHRYYILVLWVHYENMTYNKLLKEELKFPVVVIRSESNRES